MRNMVFVGAAALAVFAGVIYFARDPVEQPAATAPAPAENRAPADAPKAAASAPVPVSMNGPPARPVASDPRLAALMVSPDNGLIEFIAGADGKVITEIDNDPGSPGYRKPLREYSYAGDQVVRLVSYRYLGDQVQIVKADLAYKPDGSVDHYQESTSYEPGK